jgi:hypothetical protein
MIWHLHPLSLVSKLYLFLSLPVCRRSSLLTGEEAGGEEPNLYDGERALSSINNSILSGEDRIRTSLLFAGARMKGYNLRLNIYRLHSPPSIYKDTRRQVVFIMGKEAKP